MQQPEPTKNNGFMNRFISVLMTIITATVIGLFGFVWGINEDFARMQEREIEKEKKIDAIQLNINQMRLDQQVQKENVIRLDGKMDFLLQQQKR